MPDLFALARRRLLPAFAAGGREPREVAKTCSAVSADIPTPV
jgi:hypothetical protein